MTTTDLLTPADIAGRIGKSERWVKAHTTEDEPSRDQIRGIRFGDAWRYTADVVEDYIARRLTPPAGDTANPAPRSRRTQAHLERLAAGGRPGRRR